MGRRVPGGWLGVLAAVLGSSLLFSATASPQPAQTITFTSTPPSSPVAGVGGYTVSAQSSSGLPAEVWAQGACSLTALRANREVALSSSRLAHGNHAIPSGTPSPTRVYFNHAGRCEIRAALATPEDGRAEAAPQVLTVAKDPSEKITFRTAAPKNALVGGSYEPVVLSSAPVAVEFITATRSVCERNFRDPGAHEQVSFIAGGTCTISVRQAGSRKGPPEAQQSFMVRGSPPPTYEATIDTDILTVPLACSAALVHGCENVAIEVFAHVSTPGAVGAGRWIAVGYLSLSLGPAERQNVTVHIRTVGQRLLEERHTLAVRYIVTGEGVSVPGAAPTATANLLRSPRSEERAARRASRHT